MTTPNGTTPNGSDPDVTASKVSTPARGHAGNALIVQGYALSMQQQPLVNLSGFANLAPSEESINKTLTNAKGSAQHYLNVVLPKAIVTIANISAYFETQNALAEALTPGTDAQTAIALLAAVEGQATDFRDQARAVTDDMESLRDDFNRHSAAMSRSSDDLAVVVNGDKGVLKNIVDQLADIDGKIAGAITGVVLSGLGIAGGVIMVGVGALAEAVTGGLATALVVGGLGVTAAAIGGEVASSVVLAGLLDAKSKMLRDQAQLNAETTLAAGLSSGLQTLSSSAAAAATATQNMTNAWNLLGTDLNNLAGTLGRGKTTVDKVRQLFATAAQGGVRTVQSDVTVIRSQLAGVTPVVATAVRPGDLVRSQIAELQHA
ncbi:HBL/NHE enterotoxin family protein [Kitasatospora sp. NPDC085464]|uniref:HBL/NHE enterotoxin family protein n=1 Tax=Kitasatospora sp. NPDC085464 TaxID=3364063 RepID=UPI0037C688CC